MKISPACICNTLSRDQNITATRIRADFAGEEIHDNVIINNVNVLNTLEFLGMAFVVGPDVDLHPAGDLSGIQLAGVV